MIAFDGRTLVFAEVKTRLGGAGRARSPAPLEGLHARQRARLRRAAVAWLADPRERRPSARELRFDAIGIVVDRRGRLLHLDHLEGAW